jgi:hypothetical protein
MTPEQQLDAMIDKFTPEMARYIREARAVMRALLPQATEYVYDNYNFFVLGYGPGERVSEATFSLACQAKGISLFFLRGTTLPDPARLLRGSGNKVRSIRLENAHTLLRPEVRDLMLAALTQSPVPLRPDAKHRLLIKSISSKQRPRR